MKSSFLKTCKMVGFKRSFARWNGTFSFYCDIFFLTTLRENPDYTACMGRMASRPEARQNSPHPPTVTFLCCLKAIWYLSKNIIWELIGLYISCVHPFV